MDYETRLRVELAGVALAGALASLALCFLLANRLAAHSAVAGAVADAFTDVLGPVLSDSLGLIALEHGFGWYSLSTGVLVGVVAPLVGAFVVHREMALIGETLAHTAFAGVAVALLFGSAATWGPTVLGAALATGVVGALAVQFLAGRTATHGDVPIAIVLTGSFAVGTVAFNLASGTGGASVGSYLFGEMNAVDRTGAELMAAIAVVVVGTVVVGYKHFLLLTFDEEIARVARLRVSWYNTVLVLLTAFVVVGAIQILGIILVTGMLVVPVAAASALARGFRETVYLSVLLGEGGVVAGYLLAANADVAPGGTIVLVLIAIYLVAVAVANRSGAAVGGR